MIVTIKTPNLARDLRGLVEDVPCVAMIHDGNTMCASSSRWEMTADDGQPVRVCRLHANKAARVGELDVWRARA